jgi:hypothetical protein
MKQAYHIDVTRKTLTHNNVLKKQMGKMDSTLTLLLAHGSLGVKTTLTNMVHRL